MNSSPSSFPYKRGRLVSTEHRFFRFDEYSNAVIDAGYDPDKKPHSCSISTDNDEEYLLVYQPSRNLPTNCVIEFRLSPETRLRAFQDSYELKVKYKGHTEIEYPGDGIRGELDWVETYRAISLPPGVPRNKATGSDYEGLIINPPYPRTDLKRREASGGAYKYVIGAVGMATGIALVTVLLGRKRQL
ncbi:MAG: hypothetical protein JWR44_813 [Hymenobacter sp.]|jgi:hypothetical protein|nr:hypothetical protein [Hymenobacter sp.]